MIEIAFDTSGVGGTLALAKEGVLLCQRPLMEGRRHNVELVATLAQVMAEHGLKPADLARVHVGVGPGSFTGLRTGCAAAQALALALPACRFTRVPAADALVWAARQAHPGRAIAVSLAWKRETAWATVVGPSEETLLAPAEHSYASLFAHCPKGTLLVGEIPPALSVPAHVEFLQASVHAKDVMAVGQRAAEKGLWVGGGQILPLYPRRPEAVELWEARKATLRA